jgi:hypothetical protein
LDAPIDVLWRRVWNLGDHLLGRRALDDENPI